MGLMGRKPVMKTVLLNGTLKSPFWQMEPWDLWEENIKAKTLLLNGTPESPIWEFWEYWEAWEFWEGKSKTVPLNGTPETLF
jgi:hypothetical protein